jgi:predicted dehydrogenase
MEQGHDQFVTRAAHRIGVGIIGCGYISGIYLENLRRFANLAVLACADLIPERAAARAAEFGVPQACDVAELLADPAIDVVVNLTIPHAHAGVALAAVEAGKSVYNEKPLAIARQDARMLLEAAAARGVLVGGAPDTFLGGGLQTCRDLIDRGVIGEPVAVQAAMRCHGHEHWHPDPDFYYQPGGGPLFDMGPYYLTALTALLGPVASVSGMARVSFPRRTIHSEPRKGETIAVEVPTHVACLLEFAAGPVGTLVTSFDVWAGEQSEIEIYGSEGTLGVPDPNIFGGPVRLRRAWTTAWEEVPVERGYTGNSRGLGVADLAAALAAGRPPRAGGEHAYHVLDIMHAVHESAERGERVSIASRVERPAPLPPELREWEID